MPKTVVDCGNCAPDHHAIRNLVQSNFDAHVVQTHGADDTLKMLRSAQVDLVLVNRKLDQDYSDGSEVIRQLKEDPQTREVPVMLITNYDDHQQAAMKLGAERGFGKLAFSDPQTVSRLEPFLGPLCSSSRSSG